MLPEELKNDATVAAVEAGAAGAITGGNTNFGEVTLEIAPDRILDVLRALQAFGYERLATVTAVDHYPMEPRFAVAYHMQSVSKNLRVRLKCALGGEQPEIDSATAVYSGANWYERETFDLFGIVFRNHPNLTRIMMPEGWEGHPLRRDYPVHGHKYSYQNE
jgi:NADH-quinone oxidoreductase subunit C